MILKLEKRCGEVRKTASIELQGDNVVNLELQIVAAFRILNAEMPPKITSASEEVVKL